MCNIYNRNMIQINNINFSKKTIESIQIDNDDVKGVEVELQKTNFKIPLLRIQMKLLRKK
jgi:uncharacterized protein YunC (DUF1805 family)